MDEPTAARPSPRPPDCNAALVLADGTVFWGRGIGAPGQAVGEVCFNTAITGYQEILTDPSYAGQIITFTFPHIGNVGTNREDVETTTPAARGLVVHTTPTAPANYRAEQSLDTWLKSHGIAGLCGVDTRRLTRLIRDKGAPNGVIAYPQDGRLDIARLRAEAMAWPGLEGMDLAKEVTCRQSYEWRETVWRRESGYGSQEAPRFHVVAIDYGAKRNILRMLATHGCRVTIVPATASSADILRHRPDGIFLSNGPGDPAATGEYAVPVLRELIASGKPIFGICLGHQMLALALGGTTRKMDKGHRGANHPVRDEATGRVEITSQNHGFVVDLASLPAAVESTHISLFDKTNEGLRLQGLPVFSVQHHPEASPGPQDSHYLFERFIDLIHANSMGAQEPILAPNDKGLALLRAALSELAELAAGERPKAWTESQIDQIAKLREQYPHRISLGAPWSESHSRLNCYMYALGLDYDQEWMYADIQPDHGFISDLISDMLVEKTNPDIQEGDIIIYFDQGKPKHAGRYVQEGVVISKWGHGNTLIWAHGIWEIPAGYGNELRVFASVEKAEITAAYTQWAKSGWHA